LTLSSVDDNVISDEKNENYELSHLFSSKFTDIMSFMLFPKLKYMFGEEKAQKMLHNKMMDTNEIKGIVKMFNSFIKNGKVEKCENVLKILSQLGKKDKTDEVMLDVLLSLLTDELSCYKNRDDYVSEWEPKYRKRFCESLSEFYESQTSEKYKMIAVLLLMICGNSYRKDEILFCFPSILNVIKKGSDCICLKFISPLLRWLCGTDVVVEMIINLEEKTLKDDFINPMKTYILDYNYLNSSYDASFLLFEVLFERKEKELKIPNIDLSDLIMKMEEKKIYVSMNYPDKNLVKHFFCLLDTICILDYSLINDSHFKNILGEILDYLIKVGNFSFTEILQCIQLLEILVESVNKLDKFTDKEIISKINSIFISYHEQLRLYFCKLESFEGRFEWFVELVEQVVVMNCEYRKETGNDYDGVNRRMLIIEFLKFCRIFCEKGHFDYLYFYYQFGMNNQILKNVEFQPEYFPFLLYLFIILSSVNFFKDDIFFDDFMFIPRIDHRICFGIFSVFSDILRKRDDLLFILLKYLFEEKRTDSVLTDVEIKYVTWAFANIHKDGKVFDLKDYIYAIEHGCLDDIMNKLTSIVDEDDKNKKIGNMIWDEFLLSVLANILLTVYESNESKKKEILLKKLLEISFIERFFSLYLSCDDDYKRGLLGIVVIELNKYLPESISERDIISCVKEIFFLISLFLNGESSSSHSSDLYEDEHVKTYSPPLSNWMMLLSIKVLKLFILNNGDIVQKFVDNGIDFVSILIPLSFHSKIIGKEILEMFQNLIEERKVAINVLLNRLKIIDYFIPFMKVLSSDMNLYMNKPRTPIQPLSPISQRIIDELELRDLNIDEDRCIPYIFYSHSVNKFEFCRDIICSCVWLSSYCLSLLCHMFHIIIVNNINIFSSEQWSNILNVLVSILRIPDVIVDEQPHHFEAFINIVEFKSKTIEVIQNYLLSFKFGRSSNEKYSKF
jgi:hypothetical protein